MKNQNYWIAGGVIVVLLIGGWLMYGTGGASPASEGREEAEEVEEFANTPNPSPTVSIDGEAVSVADQPAGDSIQVSSVTLSNTGWVAVRDNNGWVLGAGRFEAGTYENVTVPLLRATVAGERYQALLYVDDGDKVFDLKKDSLVTESGGVVAGTTFSALSAE